MLKQNLCPCFKWIILIVLGCHHGAGFQVGLSLLTQLAYFSLPQIFQQRFVRVKTSEHKRPPTKWLFFFPLLPHSLFIPLHSFRWHFLPLSTSIVVKLSRTEILSPFYGDERGWDREGGLDCGKSIYNHPALCAFIPLHHPRSLRGFRVVFTCWVLRYFSLFKLCLIPVS